MLLSALASNQAQQFSTKATVRSSLCGTLCDEQPPLDLLPLLLYTTAIGTHFAISACDHLLNIHTISRLYQFMLTDARYQSIS